MNRVLPWSYFFKRNINSRIYPYYFSITFTCPTEETFENCVQSSITVFVTVRNCMREKDNVEFVNDISAAFDGVIENTGRLCVKTWFIGFEFDGNLNYFDFIRQDTFKSFAVSIKSFKRFEFASICRFIWSMFHFLSFLNLVTSFSCNDQISNHLPVKSFVESIEDTNDA